MSYTCEQPAIKREHPIRNLQCRACRTPFLAKQGFAVVQAEAFGNPSLPSKHMLPPFLWHISPSLMFLTHGVKSMDLSTNNFETEATVTTRDMCMSQTKPTHSSNHRSNFTSPIHALSINAAYGIESLRFAQTWHLFHVTPCGWSALGGVLGVGLTQPKVELI